MLPCPPPRIFPTQGSNPGLPHRRILYCLSHQGSPISSNQFSSVTQSCPTLCNPMDCSLPGSSVHGIFQARVLDWVAIAFSAISPRTHRKWGNHELGSHQQTGHQGLLFRSFNSAHYYLLYFFCCKEHWKGRGLSDHRIQILMVNVVIHFP